MSLLWCSLAALAVALCYLFDRAHRLELRRRERIIRQRVALLLWTVAHHAGKCESFASSQGNPI